ncbi:GntR family transcriptional regulator [Actinosynnema sp. NPDC047251]|uniref:Transcriptional regulator, GntR family n=1 Tax=Saccharothrix espanaensis (strain ATCC 51144 / DSM 44229 / JCM 9112 / NBRC 15066 / NRRL 15764) TaxID=1179773 RepID=K0JUE6_SACES|nr:FCD domain-containing protein [Saccharothrix espanaensis]CCH29092.1 Transcriptional regulator, GntR family [Saccharothrix espanaensis DSM 44229]
MLEGSYGEAVLDTADPGTVPPRPVPRLPGTVHAEADEHEADEHEAAGQWPACWACTDPLGGAGRHSTARRSRTRWVGSCPLMRVAATWDTLGVTPRTGDCFLHTEVRMLKAGPAAPAVEGGLVSQPRSPSLGAGAAARRTARDALSGAAARRVARPAPLREAVYDALLDLIVNRTLQPGQHLVEIDLAEHLGVSRQPVREALQRLQTEGWVDLRPAQGAFVHTPTDEEADQLLSVRGVLETHSAKLAAERATAQDVAGLAEIQQAGLRALAAEDVAGVVAANAALHAAISGLSGNTVLADLIATVDRRVRWYYAPLALTFRQDAWTEHADLIEAIGAHDPDTAGRIMALHTERTRQAYRATRTD